MLEFVLNQFIFIVSYVYFWMKSIGELPPRNARQFKNIQKYKYNFFISNYHFLTNILL